MTVRAIDIQSQVITFLRFPLVMCVLFVHANFIGMFPDEASFRFAPQVCEFVSTRIAPIANPFFFFLSGLLFFREGNFSWTIYRQKVSRRVHTLLLPYLLWNTIYLLLLFVGESIISGWTAIVDKPIVSFTVTDWINAFWNISIIGHQGGFAAPVNIPFWFVRDLLVLVALTPIFYYVLSGFRRLPQSVQNLLLLGLLMAADWWSLWPTMLATSSLFFACGAYVGLKQTNLVVSMSRYQPALWMSALLMFYYHCDNTAYLLVILALFPVVGKMLEKGRWNVSFLLSRGSFFVIGYHYLLLGVLLALLGRIVVTPRGEFIALFCYVFVPLILAFVGYLLYVVMERLCPCVLRVLTGFR